MAEPDTPDNNLILIGSETFNPWITLYKAAWTSMRVGILARMSTVFQPRSASEQTRYDYVRTIRNVHTSTPSLAYTHLALLDNSQGSGKVLIVEGTSMGTTYAALTFFHAGAAVAARNGGSYRQERSFAQF